MSIPGAFPGRGPGSNQSVQFDYARRAGIVAALSGPDDGRVLAIGEPVRGSMRFEDLNEMNNRRDFTTCVAISEDGSRSAVGSITGWIYVIDNVVAKLMRPMRVYDNIQFQGIECLAWSPDGRMIATAPTPRFLAGSLSEQETKLSALTVLTDAGERLMTFDREPGVLRQLSWSPDGALLVAAGDAGVFVFDVAKRAPKGNRKDQVATMTAQFSPAAPEILYGRNEKLMACRS